MATEALKVNIVFRDAVKSVYPHVHWQRIECWTDKGVPDINFCFEGQEHWIECKWVATQKGRMFSHKLQPEQCAWLLARSRAGGSAWVLARRVDVFRLYAGSEARSVVDRGWDGNHVLEINRPWDWEFVLGFMKG